MTRLLLRLFPAAWRARYGEELLDLVNDTGLTPRGAADIARSGLSERVRSARAAISGGASMTLGPAWRHPTAWAVIGLLTLVPLLSFLGFSVLTPYQLARLGLTDFANSLNGILNRLRYLDLLLVALPALAVVIAGLPLLRVRVTRVDGSSEASVSVRVRGLNVLVVVVGMLFGGLLIGHIVFESVMQVGP
jgi:hypothetical protein